MFQQNKPSVKDVVRTGSVFQQNKKMKKSSVLTFNFSLPAVSTCPGAGKCKLFCFAYLEQIRYPSAKAYRERMYTLSLTPAFVQTVNQELAPLIKKAARAAKHLAVRIHASGDFYSRAYFAKWVDVASANPEVTFYAYSKSVGMIKHFIKQTGALPSNLIIIYSLGGLQDRVIDVNTDRHSRIFTSEVDALDAGYSLASEDDAVAWSSSNNKVGLVMFGARKNKGNEALRAA
jgi:hypothetical protein